jgi:acyl CoA:acetate/3-ketoacid CoA transferase alpha subunit
LGITKTDMTTQQTVTRKITGQTYTVESMVMIDSAQHYVLRNNKYNNALIVSVEKFNNNFN